MQAASLSATACIIIILIIGAAPNGSWCSNVTKEWNLPKGSQPMKSVDRTYICGNGRQWHGL